MPEGTNRSDVAVSVVVEDSVSNVADVMGKSGGLDRSGSDVTIGVEDAVVAMEFEVTAAVGSPERFESMPDTAGAVCSETADDIGVCSEVAKGTEGSDSDATREIVSMSEPSTELTLGEATGDPVVSEVSSGPVVT